MDRLPWKLWAKQGRPNGWVSLFNSDFHALAILFDCTVLLSIPLFLFLFLHSWVYAVHGINEFQFFFFFFTFKDSLWTCKIWNLKQNHFRTISYSGNIILDLFINIFLEATCIFWVWLDRTPHLMSQSSLLSYFHSFHLKLCSAIFGINVFLLYREARSEKERDWQDYKYTFQLQFVLLVLRFTIYGPIKQMRGRTL